MKHREIRIKYADGTYHDLLYWIMSFTLSNGKIGGLLGVLVDISEQKILESKLSRANKRMLGELNDLITTFFIIKR